MSWDAKDLVTLKKLWTAGQSAAQIAHRLGYSRNAVCAKLLRMGLKRGHKPPTANPKIIARPSLAACHRPVEKVMSSRKPVTRQPREFTKRQLYEMLAEAVRNTG
jgi:GcrA cell cycle regulator